MKTGQTYTTGLSPEKVNEIIISESKGLNYNIESDFISGIQIEVKHNSNFIVRLFRRLPYKINWKIWQQDGETYIYCEPKLGFIYISVLILLCVLSFKLFLTGKNLADLPGSSSINIYYSCIFMILAAVLLFVIGMLVFGGGQGRLTPIFRNLRRTAIEYGTHLSETSTIAPGHSIRLISFMLFTIFLLLSILHLDRYFARFEFQSNKVLIIAMCFMLASLYYAFFSMGRNSQGISIRLIPALGGIATFMFALFILAAHYPLYNTANTAGSSITRFVEKTKAYNVIDESGSTKTDDNSERQPYHLINHRNNSSKYSARAILFMPIAFILIGIGLLIYAMVNSLKGFEYLYQISQSPDIPWSKKATDPGPFLFKFRIIAGINWLGFSIVHVIILAHLYLVIKAYILYVFSNGPLEPTNVVKISQYLLSFSFGIHPDSRLLTFSVCTLWFFYLLICCIIVIFPIMQLIIQESSYRYQARKQKNNMGEEYRLVRDSLQKLCQIRESNIFKPDIIIMKSGIPFAGVHSIGIFKAKYVLLISTGAIAILENQDLDAILAHELAHIELGHSQTDRLLRYLGRITMLGDGFIRILEDTYNNEKKADDFAKSVYKIPPDLITNWIRRFGYIAITKRFYNKAKTENFIQGAAIKFDIKDIQKATSNEPWISKVKIAFNIYMDQYLGLKYSGYWHPSLLARKESLTKLEP